MRPLSRWYPHFAVYLDLADWWVGYYRSPAHHYVCPFPTLVIRWPRSRVTRADQWKAVKP